MWQFQGREISSAPVVTGQSLIVGSEQSLIALDRESGVPIWQMDEEGFGQPIASASAIIVPAGRDLRSIDARDGCVLWHSENAMRFVSAPSAIGNLIVVGDDSPAVIAFDRNSGRRRWSVRLDALPIEDAPISAGTAAIAVADTLGNAYSISVTGQLNWKVKVARNVTGLAASSSSTFALTNESSRRADGVYVGPFDVTLQALSNTRGEVLWRFKSDARTFASPATTGEFVYVPFSNGKASLAAIRATDGKLAWQTPTGHLEMRADPLIIEDTVIVGSGEGLLYAVDASSGNVLWTHQAPDSIDVSPALDSSGLYVVAGFKETTVQALG